MPLSNLGIEIFLDTSNIDQVIEYAENPAICGFTTNPTLMYKAGVSNYVDFAKNLLTEARGKPVSLEVCADDCAEIIRQGIKIASLGNNAWVKVPVCITEGEYTTPAIDELTASEVKVNVTAIFSRYQAARVIEHIHQRTPAILSVFAGRIADTGQDPEHIIKGIKGLIPYSREDIRVLWASTREPYNIWRAAATRCDIITVPPVIYEKAVRFARKSLDELCLETVYQFYDDAQKAGYKL